MSVVVRFVVSETGEVQDVSGAWSPGGRRWTTSSWPRSGRWKFQPATKQGTRVKVQMIFKQTFLGG